MKRTVKYVYVIVALAVYIGLLGLLVWSEDSINPGDAIWYSLITMTSVGYGDVTPITFLGKCVGIVFALCSVGILAALISIGVRLLDGWIIPQVRLFLNRNRKWYVFTEANENAVILAKALKSQENNCLPVFLCGETKENFLDAVWLNMDFESVCANFKSHPNTVLFCLSSDPWKNYSQALKASSAGISSYCMADVEDDNLPENLQLFNMEESVGRSYWQKHPLKKNEHTITLIGCGRFGSEILGRALLTNVFERGRIVEYHVFGDTAHFQTIHKELTEALNGENPEEDTVIFHPGNWMQDREIFLRTDRLIICFDSDEDNLNILETLKKWYVLKGTVDVRLSKAVSGVHSFGSLDEILTPELVMKDALNRQAKLMHDLYNGGSIHTVEWRDLSSFYKESNIAAADHLLVKIRHLLENESLTVLTGDVCQRAYQRYKDLYSEKAAIFQEMEHRRWMRFSWFYNWQYSTVRKNELRLHPLLLPFDQLPEEEKKKDDYAWEMLGRLDL